MIKHDWIKRIPPVVLTIIFIEAACVKSEMDLKVKARLACFGHAFAEKILEAFTIGVGDWHLISP